MSLAEIVRVYGGDLYGSGHRASIPAPGHSRADRSASLIIGRTGKVIAYSFGRSTVREILQELRSHGLIDRAGYPVGACTHPAAPPPLTDGFKRNRALDLWSYGVPLPGTLSERYLIQRALRPADFRQARLLHHPDCPYSVYGGMSPTGPALMALIQGPDGSPTAVELTYLDSSGRRNGRCRLSRKTIGVVPPGAYVALAEIEAHMVVGEGVATTLSAMEIFGLPGRALLGARNLPNLTVPDGVDEVTIAADRGLAGEGAALALAKRLSERDVQVHLHLPEEPFDDFNRMLMGFRRGRGEGG